MRVDTYSNRVIPTITVENTTTVGIPVIHIVHILDGSGSMRAFMGESKFDSAKQGMKEEVAMLKKDKQVKYLYTIVEFDSNDRILTICNKLPIEEVDFNTIPFFEPYGNTAMYDAIGKTLTDLLHSTKDERVVVKIFTDGGENNSRVFSREKVKDLITTCENLKYVITFIGVAADVRKVQRQLNIKESNTLIHNNTSKGVKEVFHTANLATMMYSKSVVLGKESNEGFYNSNIKK